MFREFDMQMADGSTRRVPFVANGATSLRYRMVFGKELGAAISNVLTALQNSGNINVDPTADMDDVDIEQLKGMIAVVDSGAMEAVYELGYIMNAAAEHRDMRNLDINGYFDWLEQFETLELMMHSTDIIGLYLNNKTTTSTAKKNGDQLIDR